MLSIHRDSDRTKLAEGWIINGPGELFFTLLQAGYFPVSIKSFIYKNFEHSSAEISLDHSFWNGEKVILDLGRHNSGSESDDSEYYNNMRSPKDGKKKKAADKDFDVEVRSLGSNWGDDISDSDEEDHGGIPKDVSASDIIGTARTKWAEYNRAHREAAEEAWKAAEQESMAQEQAAWEAAQDELRARMWQEQMDLEHAQAESAARAYEEEAARKAAEEAASAASQEEAQKPADGNAKPNEEMDLDDKADAGSAPPNGPQTQDTAPQGSTIPVTPNSKDGVPAASERSAGQGA